MRSVNAVSAPRRRANPYLRLLCVLCTTWLVLGAWSGVATSLGPFGRAWPRLSASQASPRARSQFPGRPAAPGSPEAPPGRGDRQDAAAPPAAGRDARALGPQRILLFGDSMVPVLAPRLADYCLENGHELYPAVWYGSTIIYWAWQERLDQLLEELHPTVVIAALGSSELAVRDVGECEPYVQAIVRKVGERKLVWVGPPNWRDDTGVNAMLERVLGPRRFFRSDRIGLERRADGIHPSDEAGAKWVDALAQWMVTHSDAPIALSPPTRKAPPVPERVYSPPF
jgi:hypothetical protein